VGNTCGSPHSNTDKESVMPLRLVSSASSSLSTARRILVGAALIAIGYIAALLASQSAELPFGVGIGSAAAVKDATPPASAPSPSAATSSAPDYDYFPDHYQNQAREAAEPASTF
jgi:hypothetical protein